MYLSLIPVEIREKLNEFIPGIHIEDSVVTYDHPQLNSKTVIPSKHYPLSKQRTISLFTTYNTEEVLDETIHRVFNSCDFPVGRCYSNTMRLAEECKKHGIIDIRTFVGWITSRSTLPIHHCWLVYKDNHILDGGIFKSTELKFAEFVKDNPHLSMQEYRQVMTDLMIEESKKRNSESRTIGKVNPLYWYVGTECNPHDGIDIYNRLIDRFPDHPSYRNPGQNPNGASETQKMIFDQLNKK